MEGTPPATLDWASLEDLDRQTSTFLETQTAILSEPILAELAFDLRPAHHERQLLVLVDQAFLAPDDRAMIRRALEFAQKAHEGQVQSRKTEPGRLPHIPYLNHPVRVASIALESLELGAHAIAAALLHDVVEDTETSLPDLERPFPSEVARLVALLSREKGQSREDFLAHVSRLEGDARTLKAIDRLHNLLRSFTSADRAFVRRYIDESRRIYRPLFEQTPAVEPLRAKFEFYLGALEVYADRLEISSAASCNEDKA